MSAQKFVDREALTAALEATLRVHDADIGWGVGKGYHYGEPPSVEQIVTGMWARLPITREGEGDGQ